ncbi:MAG: hypothetical protein IJ019_03515 [Alphaproteobacteria bacterium]|nr:hypothetical protein [Alphaproteobacteria bacterium]
MAKLLDWGRIIVKQDNEEFVMDFNGKSISDDLISVSGNTRIECYLRTEEIDFQELVGDEFELTNEYGDTIQAVISDTYDFNGLVANLTISANVEASEYTGTYVISVTYYSHLN